MKRVLSLVLVLVLALGSVPFAFAADKTAGETLQEYGLAKGVDAAGNLNEEGMLTRAEMMVVLSRLLGVEEEAMNYAIPSTSKDVEGHWAAKYVAYAEQVGKWTSGTGENMFSPDAKVTTQMVAKFMMTALGYEANWETAVADATALGLMEGVTAGATAEIKRGELFKAALNTVNTPVKDTETKLGTKLGVLKDETAAGGTLADAKIDTVKAVANNLVEVTFEDDVDAAAAANVANYGITEKTNTSNVIVINEVRVEDTDKIVIETAALKLGVGYTLTFDGKATNFSGIAKDTDIPEVESVKGTDTGIVEVVFKEALIDKATAEDIANYSIDKEGTVVKAALKSDRKTVKLTVEGLTSTTVKNLTVENVLSIDKVAMKKTTKVFFPKFDKFAPTFTIDTTARANNVKVVVFVTDEHGIDKATAEDVANYSIEGLTVTKAKVGKQNTTDKYDNKITLTTSEQTNGKSYSLKINNLIDGSNAKNAITKEVNLSFRGAAADKTKPVIKSVTAKTNTTIHVEFTEANNLDETSALNPANYVLDKTDFSILEAKFLDDEKDSKVIVLTTSTQPDKVSNFKMTISGVADEFNNTMEKVSRFFPSAVEDTTKPVVDKAYASKVDKVKVVFAKEVKKSTAIDPTNYVVNKEIGSPTDAELDSTGKIVTLTFDNLEAATTYELTISNVTNLYDVAMDAKTVKFVGVAEGTDKDAPELDSFYMTNRSELRVVFNEKITATGTTITAKTGTATTITFTYKATLADGKTAVYAFDTTGKTSTDAGIKGETFTIETVASVTDKAGNPFVYDTANKLTLTGVGEGDFNAPKLLSWAQTDLRTFTLYFDKEVSFPNTSLTTYTTNTLATSNGTFTLERDDDDYSIVTAKASSALASDFKGFVNFKTEITDLISNVAKDEVIELAGGLVDETSPNIVSVTAIDNKHIEIKYDEDLATAGTYTITENGKTATISNTASVEDDVVTLTLATALDSDKVYDLKQGASKATDLAKKPNKANDAGTFTFVGVDNDAAKVYIYGVELVNGNHIKVKTSEKVNDNDVITITGGDVAMTFATNTTGYDGAVSGSVSTIEMKNDAHTPFLIGTTYTVKITTSKNSTAAYDITLEFEGTVKKLDYNSGSVSGFEKNDNFNYALVSSTGTVKSTAVTMDSDGTVTLPTGVSFATGDMILVKLGTNVIYVIK